MRIRAALLTAAWAAVGLAQPPLPERPGPAPDGTTVLVTGWRIQPAGRQVPVGSFPIRSRVSPDGRWLAVLNAGAEPSVAVFSTADFREVDRAELPDAGYGMVFTPEGRTLYVAGGAAAAVYEFTLTEDGKLKKGRTFSTVPRGEQKSPEDFTGDVEITPDGRLLYVTALFRNEVQVINPQSGWVIERFAAPRRPYRVLPHPGGGSYFVTSWAEGSLHQFDDEGNHLGLERLGLQPMDMVWQDRPPDLEEEEEPPLWKARIFVTVAGADRVQVIGVREGNVVERLEPIRLAMWPWQPAGMTPTALALAPDQKRLYVVCSDANAVAVVDVSQLEPRVLGYVPTGAYPTDVSALPGGKLVALSAKDDGAGEGTASLTEPLDEIALFDLTKQVLRLSPYIDERMIGFREIPLGSPIPPGAKIPEEYRSPIRHVLYIVKGGLSFDEVFGDFERGNGDRALVRFAEAAPNHRKLAREFVIFDNFYVCGDGEAPGLYWATAAIAPAFVERLWPAVAAGRLRREIFRPSELAAAPPAGYLWTQAAHAGLAVRNYGLMVENLEPAPPDGPQVRRVLDPGLKRLTDRAFRGPDPSYPDMERARAFLRDLERMEQAGEMPRLMVMRLAGDAPRTPEAVADNDRALGMIVEACTRSRFWPRMAIFVAESAPGGRDHVDGRRSVALAISPYARRGFVDSTFYNAASVLRTVELILGLNPMTQFDAAALPLWQAFQLEPDTRPYKAAGNRPGSE